MAIILRDKRLEKFYRSYDFFIRCYELGAAIVSVLSHQNPGLKILEIGAGTGGALMRILRALSSDFATYDFTDVAPNFFQSAKEEQCEWSNKTMTNVRRLLRPGGKALIGKITMQTLSCAVVSGCLPGKEISGNVEEAG